MDKRPVTTRKPSGAPESVRLTQTAPEVGPLITGSSFTPLIEKLMTFVVPSADAMVKVSILSSPPRKYCSCELATW